MYLNQILAGATSNWMGLRLTWDVFKFEKVKELSPIYARLRLTWDVFKLQVLMLKVY